VVKPRDCLVKAQFEFRASLDRKIKKANQELKTKRL